MIKKLLIGLLFVVAIPVLSFAGDPIQLEEKWHSVVINSPDNAVKEPLKIVGRWTIQVLDVDGTVIETLGPYENMISNDGETALRDCFGGTGTPTCTTVQNFKYHAIGTSNVATAETQTACQTELTTQYNPDNIRATGSQTNNGANIYRTVGTNTVDSNVTIEELCLMSSPTVGAGTQWSRDITISQALTSGQSLQTTYDLTIE